jgi:transcriptional antiterminator RfaH
MRGGMVDTLSWFVVRTNPKQEERASGNLTAYGIETFAPKYIKYRYNEFTNQPTRIVKPLFMNYIFARFAPGAMLHKVRYTRGVHSIVSFGNGPTPVDQSIISAIQSRIGPDGYLRLGSGLDVGDKVSIKEGPFKNFMGIFEREMNDNQRVIILLNMVSFHGHLEVSRELVRKVS